MSAESRAASGIPVRSELRRKQVDGADDDTPSSPSRFVNAFGLPFGRMSGGGLNGGAATGASGPRSSDAGGAAVGATQGPASPPARTLSSLGSGLQVRTVVAFAPFQPL